MGGKELVWEEREGGWRRKSFKEVQGDGEWVFKGGLGGRRRRSFKEVEEEVKGGVLRRRKEGGEGVRERHSLGSLKHSLL